MHVRSCCTVFERLHASPSPLGGTIREHFGAVANWPLHVVCPICRRLGPSLTALRVCSCHGRFGYVDNYLNFAKVEDLFQCGPRRCPLMGRSWFSTWPFPSPSTRPHHFALVTVTWTYLPWIHCGVAGYTHSTWPRIRRFLRELLSGHALRRHHLAIPHSGRTSFPLPHDM